MPTRTVAVGSASGLHARPAALFVAAAAKQPVPVTISTEGARKPVPARSMLGVLSLGAKQGTEVTLEASGDGAGRLSPIRFPCSPERWWGDEALQAEAQAPQAPREQRHQAAGNIPALRSRGLFSAGVRFSTASHMPVDTAQ